MPLTKVTQHSLGNSAVTTAKLGTAPFAFANSSANIVFMAANGNIGVGLSNPTQKLEVTGNIKINSGVIVGERGTASAPAFSFSDDTDTGMFNISNQDLGFATQASERMRITANGNVGIGTTGPGARLDVYMNSPNGADTLKWTANNGLLVNNSDTTYNSSSVSKIVLNTTAGGYNNGGIIYAGGAGAYNAGFLGFATGWDGSSNATLRMRINASGGGVRIACENYDNQPSSTNFGVEINNTNSGSTFFGQGTGTESHLIFGNRNGVRGSIQTTSGGTSFNTTSDYRLKENIARMTGALSKVAQLNPVTYNWKIGGSSQGFIAHELQAIVPEAVTGEKDAIDENDEPKYQMVDTSFLVATLAAAIQELKAEFDAYKASHP